MSKVVPVTSLQDRGNANVSTMAGDRKSKILFEHPADELFQDAGNSKGGENSNRSSDPSGIQGSKQAESIAKSNPNQNSTAASKNKSSQTEDPVDDIDSGLQSNFATVFKKETQSKAVNNAESNITQEEVKFDGPGISEKLLENYENNYMKKFPFEKGQYHQCIPNPYRQNEYITVMLVDRSLKYAGADEQEDAGADEQEDAGNEKSVASESN